MTDIWPDSLPSQMLPSRNSAPNFEGLAGVSCWPDPICANAGQCWRTNYRRRVWRLLVGISAGGLRVVSRGLPRPVTL